MKKHGFRSIRTLLVTIIVVIAVAMGVGITAFSIMHSISNNKKQLASYREQIETDVENELKHETEIAVSVIEEVHAKQEAGELTEEEAKKEAADRVRELRYNDGNGYFWVDDYEGVNVVLLGRDTEGESRIDLQDPNGKYFIKEMIENGKKDGGGFTDLMFAKPDETEPLPKRNYTVSYEPYQWVLGTGVWIDNLDEMEAAYKASSDASLKNTIITTILFSCVMLVIFAVVAIWIGGRVTKPIIEVTEDIREMGSGKFREVTQDDPLVRHATRRDEIGTMSGAIIDLHASIRDLMNKIMDTTTYVKESAEQLNTNTEQSAEASEMVAQSITNVATSCTEQETAVDSANGETMHFADSMGIFSQVIDENSKLIADTNSEAQRGSKEIGRAVVQMEEIEKAVSETSEVVDSLGERLSAIDSIVNTISDIASQTNLLSLNASIEAARAGDAGRGFAVVADEIRQLADQSNEAAGQITELINRIQDMSREAVDAMKLGLESVRGGTAVVTDAGSVFDNIASMVNDISDKSDEMEHLMAELNEGTKKITGSIDHIEEMSRAVSSESENVSAASEQQTASMHEIADASKSLAGKAQELQAEVGRFTV